MTSPVESPGLWVVPWQVRATLRVAAADIAHVAALLRSAATVEWVSDAAPLYLLRLGQAADAISGVAARVDAAEASVAAATGAA